MPYFENLIFHSYVEDIAPTKNHTALAVTDNMRTYYQYYLFTDLQKITPRYFIQSPRAITRVAQRWVDMLFTPPRKN